MPPICNPCDELGVTLYPDLNDPNYDPVQFLDWLTHDVFRVKNDAALAEKLDVSPPVISKVRCRRKTIGPTILCNISEITGIPTREIRRKWLTMELACTNP